MTTHLAAYFHDRRNERGLTLAQLAMIVGYRNIRKGANKIARFERQGRVTEELLAMLAEALEIDFPTVEALVQKGANHVR
jgi:transcriptional regulator with XRE-family HTH domain